MTDIITSTANFPWTPVQREQLSSLVSAMLPRENGMPPGNHPEIFNNLLEQMGKEVETTRAGLETLAKLAAGAEPSQDYLTFLDSLREQTPAFFNLLQNQLLTVYYQHPAVLSAIGVAPRAPYPEGRAVAPTDWSLLEPVQARAPFFREA